MQAIIIITIMKITVIFQKKYFCPIIQLFTKIDNKYFNQKLKMLLASW